MKYNDHTQVWYSSKTRLTSKYLSEVVAGSDVIFINGIYSWNYNYLAFAFRRKVRTIISARGMLHPGALSQKSLKKKIYLQFLKLIGIQKSCAFHASTPDEAVYIRDVFGDTVKIYVANNFPRIFEATALPIKVAGHLELVSIALVSPMKNHLLVLKALMNSRHVINYKIYGPVKDENYWNDCLDVINKMPPNITVTYMGDLKPGDVEAALTRSHVFIMPSKSENFGHSIFEALSAGRPVITSFNTPWQKLQVSYAGMNIDPSTTGEIENAISMFAEMDMIALKQWAEAAKIYAHDHFDLELTRAQYSNMFGV